MKFILPIISALGLTLFTASAQVSVEVMLGQDQFLPGETLPVAVKITNRSGQTLHFGTEANWLTFSVESEDGGIVIKKSEVPVPGEFDLESSQLGIKRVDLAPYFGLNKPGRYKITATLRIKNWAAVINSAPKIFDVINGVNLWSQDFGMPSAASGQPEVRKFTLVQANYLRSQLQLYVRVTDAEEVRIFKVATLGSLVSFSQPEAQVDRLSRLHVLWQAGAQSFNCVRVNADGEVERRDIYDNFNNVRPHFVMSETGEVTVVGGVRRIKPEDRPVLPAIKAPNELPAAAPQSPPK
jgi:hypothetical protein